MIEKIEEIWGIMKEEIPDATLLSFIYYVAVIIFSILLNNYNGEIVGKSALDIMSYKNGLSWGFLLFAIVFIILGYLLIYYYWHMRKRKNFEENFVIIFVILIVYAILDFICSIVIVILINNPIFTAAVTFITAIYAFAVVSK